MIRVHARFARAAACAAAALLLSCPTAVAAGGELVPMGNTVGITMQSQGVIVVGLAPDTDEPCPARQAGVHEGDIITMLDGSSVASGEDISQAVEKMDGSPVELTVRRDDRELDLTLTPRQREDGRCELGVLLRDGLSGIGTVTYCDPETGDFGALGHPVSDVDTGILIPLRDGEIIRSSVADVVKGSSGAPGQLVGTFDAETKLGDLDKNTLSGLFGTLDTDGLTPERGPVPVADLSEVHRGEAVILSNVSGDSVEEYAIEIERVSPGAADGRNMTIRVTDADLLALTGGIVQGMSGSPILQDGRLVGAVTHVFVNDPTMGYGIFIGNMLAASGDGVLDDAA